MPDGILAPMAITRYTRREGKIEKEKKKKQKKNRIQSLVCLSPTSPETRGKTREQERKRTEKKQISPSRQGEGK